MDRNTIPVDTLFGQMIRIRTTRAVVALFVFTMVFLVALPFVATVGGQPLDLPSEQFSLDEGLADRLVTDVLLHSNGFVWIATPSGLNRFDGYTFVEYDDHQDQVPSLSEINIDNIFEDYQQRITIQYRYNFYRFDLLDPNTNLVKRVDLFPYKDIQGIARAIVPDRQGYIHVVSISDGGTHIFKLEEELTELFVIPEQHKIVTSEVSLAPLADGSFLLNDEEKGLRWIDSTGTITNRFVETDFEGLNRYPDDTNILHQDASGRIWLSFSATNAVFLLENGAEQWQQVSSLSSKSPAQKVWEDEEGNLLFGFGTGTGRPPEYDQLVIYTTRNQVIDQSYLRSGTDGIFTFEARNFFNEVFIGSGNGLRIVQNNQTKIAPLLVQSGQSDPAKADITGLLGTKSESLYITTRAGEWYRFDPELSDLDTLVLRNQYGRRLPPVCGGPVLEASDGIIWSISCKEAQNAILTAFDPNTGSTRRFPYSRPFIDIAEDDNGILWLICDQVNNKGLLVRFDPSTGNFEEFLNEESGNPLRESLPYCVETSGDSLIWIGTNRGIQRISILEKTSSRFIISRNPESTNSYSVLTIYPQSDSLLWLGTNHGLVAFQPTTGILSALNRKDGLSHDRILGILPDDQGNLWISTYYGLSHFDRQQGLFRKFFREDGLTSNEFNPNAAWRSRNDIYFFGSTNGLNSFVPKDLLVRETPPQVLLTRITQYNPGEGGQKVQTTNLDQVRRLKISPSVTYFQLNFTLPVYDRPSKNQFIAWLEGYDKDWIYLGNNPVVRYTKLPPGRYTLHVKGAPPNGIWSAESLIIPVIVEQVFYKTWWFILLVIALAAGIIYLYLQARLEQRLKVERLRTKLSSDLHDEMSGLLSGIAMQTDVLQMRVEDGPAKDKLKRIGQVSRQAMSKMNDVIWSIDSRKDKMENLIEHMRDHADNILHPLEINYDLDLIKIDPSVIIPFEIRQELFFIFKEAINNVAKHANATEVRVLLENTGKEFRLKVVDNGKGAVLTGFERKGQGLTNLKMRAQRIRANLNIKNEKGFAIELKMKRFA